MKTYCLLITLFVLTESVVLPSIPNHLLECYRGGGPILGAPKRLDVLLSLLRKLELNSQLDLRMFSSALLRSLRLDGIEQSANAVETDFVLPYRASGFQFHKYKMLMDLFLPSQNLLEIDDILTRDEKCLLHIMLSSAVQQWERGDESVVCPISVEQRQSMVTEGTSRIISRCPIENGIIQTAWGDISAGTLVAGIAASLESQSVLVADILNADIFQTEVAEPLMTSAKQEWFDNIETLDVNLTERQTASPDISNVWVATLAGDLSEVVINQGPRVGAAPQRMVVGSNNRWNDTLLPRNYYLLTQNASVVDWHLTDAEILAGIDGLILSQYVPTWVDQRSTLRITQIIDMYYSEEGVSFDPSVKACNRQGLFYKLFDSTELLTQTARFAHILSLQQITVYNPLDEMRRISEAAVTAFVNYVPTIMRQKYGSCQVSHSVPVVDMMVATDGSWKSYDVEQFISWLGGALELNLQRSTLGLIHGNTGNWIAPCSDNLTTVFSHISNFTEEWPNRLNLPSVISTVIQHSLNKTLEEANRQASSGPSTVVLVVSPNDTPSANELERARELMRTLRTTYYDIYFAYASRDVTQFQNVNENLDYSEMFLTTTTTNVQYIINEVDTYLVKAEVPTRIMGVVCPFNGTVYNQTEYEDFVLPGRARSYRIHPYYLRNQPLINVKFRNAGQGRLLVCMWRGADTSHSCQTIAEREVTNFNLTRPCESPEFCLPAHFSVTALNTSNVCANSDCRLPHQVSYYVQHAGLRCSSLRNTAETIILSRIYILLTVIISIYVNK